MTGVDRVTDLVSGICLIAGALLSLAAGVGLVRFPDVLTRMHAATKPQVLGLMLVLTGAGLRLRVGSAVSELLLVGLFQFLTAPVAAHLVSRAAYRSRQYRRDLLVVNELSQQSPGEPDGVGWSVPGR